MKSLLKIITVVILLLLLQSCNKAKTPQLTTADVSEITTKSSASGGEVVNNGGDIVISRGVCWSTEQNPVISSDTTLNGSGNGPFKSKIARLTANTTYYVRAYATNSEGVGYGNSVSFKTNPVQVPTLTTTELSAITNLTAVSGGNITDDGGSSVTARGVCWNTSTGPTTSNNLTADGTGTGNFTSNLANLQSATNYFVRAYATNSAGTVYGNELTFTTLCTAPDATTNVATNIGPATATLNAVVNANSSSAVVTFEYGLTTAYGTSITATQSPVTGITNTTVSASISGLAQSSVYHFRVKAVNCGGTTNGSDQIFQTSCTTPVPGVGTITQPTCTIATGSVVLTGLPATGTWTLTRAPGGSITTGSGTSTSVTGLTAGTYTFSVTSSSGCVSQATGNVVINPQLVTPAPPQVGAITQPTCTVATGSVALSGLPETGTWTLTPTTTTGTGTSSTVTGLTAGTYTFTVTNTVGCISTASGNVVINPQPTIPPSASTSAASNVGGTTTTLNGSVIASGASTVVTFQYGTTTSYGSEIPAIQSPITGSSLVSGVATGLSTPVTYHYRVKAVNCVGTSYGTDQTFTTTTFIIIRPGVDVIPIVPIIPTGH